jgi:2-isopropylmalate synthase
MHAIEIYDTTLRDGAQAEDVSFSIEDKLRIVEKLDELGVHYIEGGRANPKMSSSSRRSGHLPLRTRLLRLSGWKADQP